MTTALKFLAALIVIPAYMVLYFGLLTANWVMDKFVKETK